MLEQRKLTCDVGKRLEINEEIATLYRPIQVRELRTALVRLVVLENGTVDKILERRVHHLGSVIKENTEIMGKIRNEISRLVKDFELNFTSSCQLFNAHSQGRVDDTVIKQFDDILGANSGILASKRYKEAHLNRLQQLHNKLETKLKSWREEAKYIKAKQGKGEAT